MLEGLPNTLKPWILSPVLHTGSFKNRQWTTWFSVTPVLFFGRSRCSGRFLAASQWAFGVRS